MNNGNKVLPLDLTNNSTSLWSLNYSGLDLPLNMTYTHFKHAMFLSIARKGIYYNGLDLHIKQGTVVHTHLTCNISLNRKIASKQSMSQGTADL